MSDVDYRFIYALLRANHEEQERFYSRQIPKGVFATRQREIKWIYDHRERHGAYPSLASFKAYFKDSPPRHSEKIDAVLQPILDMGMYNQMCRVNLKVKDLLEKGTPTGKAMSVFKAEAARLSAYSVDYVDINFSKDSTAFDRYKSRAHSRVSPGGRQRILSPWKSLNSIVKFFAPCEVLALVARMGMSKTWLAIYWADYLAFLGFRVVFFTKEMGAQQVHDRLEALRFGLDYERFRDGSLTLNEQLLWQHRREKLVSAGVPYDFIICGDETIEGHGLSHIGSKIQEYKPDVGIIDGAYLIEPEGLSRSASRPEKLGQISNRIKTIARATNTFMIEVLQMNRAAEKTKGKGTGGGGGAKGTLADIFGSDTWAQDADWVMEISGKRGSERRNLALLKGRESALCSFNIRSQITPTPSFDELVGSALTSTGKVSFKGVS